MYKMYKHVDQGSNPDDICKNIVVYSALKNIEAKLPFNNFAIKYVLNGIETYTVNGQKYNLNAGEFLLCNAYSVGSIFVDSKHDVEGICIDVSTEILAEVLASHSRPDSCNPDIDLDKYFMTSAFMECHGHHANGHLGASLNKLGEIIHKNPNTDYVFETEFYYNICENIISDCKPIYKQLQAIGSVKSDTKKDLLRRLSTGKKFIDHQFTASIDISQVAVEAQISQYHFYRLFKNVYGISPYQYIKQRRLNLAKAYIEQGSQSISEIAYMVGYSDIFSLSKAYKQHFGKAPTVL
jgi:AraC family transcriptional regulator